MPQAHEVEYLVDGKQQRLQSHGIGVNIIDFTLSRLEVEGGRTYFCDLQHDDSIFQGKGDIQFDVYRSMKKTNRNKWEPFNPKTNVQWLHYLVQKMLAEKKIKGKYMAYLSVFA